MDVTQCQTVNIAKTDPGAPSNSGFSDRTVTFSANAADMEVTQCLTGNIAADHILDTVPPRGDRTVTVSADMDMTQCHTDHMAGHWATTSPAQKTDSNFLPSSKVQNRSLFSQSSDSGFDCPSISRPSLGRALNPGFKSLSKRSATGTNPAIEKAVPATPASVSSEDNMADKTEPSEVVPAVPHSQESVMMANPPEDDLAEAQPNPTPDPLQCDVSALVSSPHFVDATQTPPQQIGSPNLIAPPRESRRMSFADLQSKVRRLSQMVHAAPGHTAPLPQLKLYLDCQSKEESPDVASRERRDDTQEHSWLEGELDAAASATPFKVKGGELVSRISVGEFKPRLPQRGRSNDSVKATPTPNIASEPQGLDCNVSDLYDEELGSCEDMSEMLDTDSLPCKATERASLSQEVLEDAVFHEEDTSDANLKKRPLTSDEEPEEQKKRRTSTEMAASIDMV